MLCGGGKVKKRKGEKVWAVVLAVAALAACEQRGVDLVENSDRPPMRTVTDGLDRRITVPLEIKRVVSTAPSVTEMIFAAGAGARLVGVTTFCNYPEEAGAIAKIGDTMNPNLETIIALRPEVVFVSSASQLEAFTKTLEQNGIVVYVMSPRSISDMLVGLLELGDLLATKGSAQEFTDRLEVRRHVVHNKLGTCPPDDECVVPLGVHPSSPVKVFVQISKEPLFTIGRDAFLNDLISAAAGRSVTATVDTAFPKLSKETALMLQPEAIILSDSPDNQEPNEAFRNSPAVKYGRVYKINADILSRPGPRLVDALEQIARVLHPEKFPE